VEQLAACDEFSALDTGALRAELDPHLYVGRAPEQVLEFVQGPVARLLASLETFSTIDKAVVNV